VEGYTSESEQVEVIRKWLKDNGKSLLLGLAIGLLALGGYRYWDETRNLRAESASVNYEQLLGLLEKNATDDARKAGQTIIDNYGDSTYARLTALLLAKLEMGDGKTDAARARLQWVIDHAGSDNLTPVAQARLAQIALHEGKADAAWALLEKSGLTKTDRFAELQGDILAARGKTDEAVAKYRKAQAEATAGGGNPAIVELKLERLGRSGDGA
jgi:predicted negative regulator of RcsB-dependent stress response